MLKFLDFTQKRIQNLSKRLRWSIFQVAKLSIVDVWEGSEYHSLNQSKFKLEKVKRGSIVKKGKKQ